MFEKVNPMHPDKVADRIAGALVDLAYTKSANPKIAVEVLIGHGKATVMVETSEDISSEEVATIVQRISGICNTQAVIVPQDSHLASNQSGTIKCGDNGIFRGCPMTGEQIVLTEIATKCYEKYKSDGKYLIDGSNITICQSSADNPEDIKHTLAHGNLFYMLPWDCSYTINPLGPWTGGSDVDCGATNRKLGSDMGDAVTGGGLHGKDLSKADVTLNIYCFIKALHSGKPFELSCSIGDSTIDGKSYAEIVEIARTYIETRGGFEKFAEWGLII